MRQSVYLSMLCCSVLAADAIAADHTDSPATMAEPNADITDVYAWMSADAANLNLVMNVQPFAGANAQFSDAITYAFHVNSVAALGGTPTETLVLCKFYVANAIECWAGAEYVTGDPSVTAGIVSASNRMRVFAGLRDDPFFFELEGFRAAVAAVKAATPTLTIDAEGCPDVDAATSQALVDQLQHGAAAIPGDPLPAVSDTFEGANVLSIVVQIDKTLVTDGGPIIGVWGSTHRSN